MATTLFNKRKTFSELEGNKEESKPKARKTLGLRQNASTNSPTNPPADPTTDTPEDPTTDPTTDPPPEVDSTDLSCQTLSGTGGPTWTNSSTTQFTLDNLTEEEVVCLKRNLVLATDAPITYSGYLQLAICKNRYLVKLRPGVVGMADNTTAAQETRELLQHLGVSYSEETVLYVTINVPNSGGTLSINEQLAQINTVLWSNVTVLAEYFDSGSIFSGGRTNSYLILQVAAEDLHLAHQILDPSHNRARSDLRCYCCRDPTCPTREPLCKYPVPNCNFCYPGFLFKCEEKKCEKKKKTCKRKHRKHRHCHRRHAPPSEPSCSDSDSGSNVSGSHSHSESLYEENLREKGHAEVYEIIPKRKH